MLREGVGSGKPGMRLGIQEHRAVDKPSDNIARTPSVVEVRHRNSTSVCGEDPNADPCKRAERAVRSTSRIRCPEMQ